MAESPKTLEVSSRLWSVDTGIDVAAGERLRFEAEGRWWDASYEAGPEGVDIPQLRRLRWIRRVRGANWAALCGSVGGRNFPIAAATATLDMPGSGRLKLFFNDAYGFYRNNRGALTVRIYRQ